MNIEPAVDLSTAMELASTVALLKYFPRRDPHALAAVASAIREMCSSPTEAQTLVDAIGNGQDRWDSIGSFKAKAEAILAAIRKSAQPAAGTTSATCLSCPFKAKLNHAQRVAGIAWAQANCPSCPLCDTARLIAQDEAADLRAWRTIQSMQPAERQALEQACGAILDQNAKRSPNGFAHEEPFRTRNIRRLMIAKTRSKNPR